LDATKELWKIPVLAQAVSGCIQHQGNTRPAEEMEGHFWFEYISISNSNIGFLGGRECTWEMQDMC